MNVIGSKKQILKQLVDQVTAEFFNIQTVIVGFAMEAIFSIAVTAPLVLLANFIGETIYPAIIIYKLTVICTVALFAASILVYSFGFVSEILLLALGQWYYLKARAASIIEGYSKIPIPEPPSKISIAPICPTNSEIETQIAKHFPPAFWILRPTFLTEAFNYQLLPNPQPSVI